MQGLLRRMKPPICHANKAASATRNSAPANASVASARAIATGAYGGALFIAGFAALFAWQIGGFLTRNKPRRYTFDALPQDLLP